jgi:hypothetical protein
MAYHRFLTPRWWRGGFVLVLGMCLAATAQQAAQPSDAALVREGARALAAANGEQPRYGGTFLSADNEEIPFYDLHQTSLGGIYAATAPAYNCLRLLLDSGVFHTCIGLKRLILNGFFQRCRLGHAPRGQPVKTTCYAKIDP